MRFSILCNGEPIGSAELRRVDEAPNWASGFLDALPAFEPVRQVLDQAERGKLEALRELGESLEADVRRGINPLEALGLAALLPPEGGFVASHTQSDAFDVAPFAALSRRMNLRSMAAAVSSAQALIFTAVDEAGSVVAGFVFVRPVLGDASSEERPRVDVCFDSSVDVRPPL